MVNSRTPRSALQETQPVYRRPLPSGKLGEIAVVTLATEDILLLIHPPCCHIAQQNYTFLRVLQLKFIYSDNHTTNLL